MSDIETRVNNAVKWAVACEKGKKYKVTDEQLDVLIAIATALRTIHSIDLTTYDNNVIKFDQL